MRNTIPLNRASTGDSASTGSPSIISIPKSKVQPIMLAPQTWATCRSTNVTGPPRCRNDQKMRAQVPKPTVQMST